MDFIKIPELRPEGVADAVIRISSITSVRQRKIDDKAASVVVRADMKPVYSPMSVAKIYDLIWQTELSKEAHENHNQQ